MVEENVSSIRAEF